MTGLLLLLQTAIAVTAEVDRNRLPIGEELTYSLRAVSKVPGAFRVELPTVAGLEIVERVERLDEIGGTRTYQLDLTLRAMEVGSWRYGPVLVLLGNETEAAPDLTVVVTGTTASDPTRNPRLMDLIRSVPPPRPGDPASLVTVVSSPRVHQGSQLDVLTAAWFSRSLRGRLRRPPTLKPPVLAGVWSVPQPAVPGIISTRAVGDDVYDLFVSHQVAFPLTAGTLTVPPARLEYAVPLSRRASGDERPEQALSGPVAVSVLPLPEAGRPDGFRGPTGQNLRLGYRIVSLPAHAGEPLPVDLTVSGTGNLAFWAPPSVAWPAGTRAYLDRTDESPRTEAGLLGGTKTFHYLLVSDSAGSVALPALAYDYFDAAGAEYRRAEAAGQVIPVLPGRSRVAGREAPPLVAVERVIGIPAPLAPGAAWWWLAALVPALGILARSLAGIRRRPPPPPARRQDGVEALEALVSRLVPEPDRGHGELLERSLRRAGVPKGPAARAAAIKVELDRLRFTPGDSSGVAGLGREAGELLRTLPAKVRRRAGVVIALLGMVGTASGQESPETLYREGAYRPAAAGFEARAAGEPDRWEHWYHAAAARYLSGDDAEAAAFLTRALDLAPRARPARLLWNVLERQYEPLHLVRPRPGLSGPELGVLSLGIWLTAAVAALVWWRRPRVRATVIAAGLVALGVAAGLDRRDADRAFVTAATRLRRSPHGLAPEEGAVVALTRVTVVQRQPGWALVTDRLGSRGWIPSGGLVPIDRLD